MHIESCSIYNDKIRRRLSMLVLSEHDSPCQEDTRASGFRIFFLRCDRTSPYSPNRTKIQSKKRLSVYIYTSHIRRTSRRDGGQTVAFVLCRTNRPRYNSQFVLPRATPDLLCAKPRTETVRKLQCSATPLLRSICLYNIYIYIYCMCMCNVLRTVLVSIAHMSYFHFAPNLSPTLHTGVRETLVGMRETSQASPRSSGLFGLFPSRRWNRDPLQRVRLDI